MRHRMERGGTGVRGEEDAGGLGGKKEAGTGAELEVKMEEVGVEEEEVEQIESWGEFQQK